MTQEAWAEAVGYSVKAIQLCEAGTMEPSDDAVLRMAEVSELPILVHWHYRQKSRIGAELLPEVEQVSLPQAVVSLLNELRELERRKLTDKLLEFAADGVIDRFEMPEFILIINLLNSIIQAATLLKYAEGIYTKLDREVNYA